MTHRVTAAALLLLACGSDHASAASKLACNADGDTWAITGATGRPATCVVTCLLGEGKGTGTVDRVSCSFTTSGVTATQPFCDGYGSGRRWTTATVLNEQCAYND